MTSDFISNYCGTSSVTIWDNGSLSPCFQDSVLWLGLYIIFIIIGVFRLIQVLRKPLNIPEFQYTLYIKEMCHLFLMSYPAIVLLSYLFRVNLEIFQIIYYASSLLIWTFSLILMNLEYSRSSLHTWVLKFFWTAAFLCSALRMQTIVGKVRVEDYSFWAALVYAVALLSMAILTCLSLFLNSIPGVQEDDYHKLSEEERQTAIKEKLKYHNLTLSVNGTHYGSLSKSTEEFREPCPEEKANILSRLTYYWLDPLLKTGNERVLEDQDLYELTKKDTSEYNGDLFDKYWKQELNKEKPSLLRALAKAYGFKFILAGFLKLANDILVFVGPFCLNRIVAYIEEADDDDATTPLWVAFLYVFFMTAGALGMSLCQQTYFYITFRISMRVRSAIVTAVYQKAFKLNNEARQSSTVGEIVNHMSIDTQRLMELIPYLHQLWSGPLQIIVCLIALGIILSWSLLAGIALMILSLPLNAIIIKKLQALQKNIMMKKDQRTRLTNEVLQGIRVIKFFAWEDSFRDAITVIRNIEIRDLRKAAYLTSIVMFMWMSTPLFVSIVTFTTYTLVGNTLTATTAFTSLALFNILRFPLNMLPNIISSMINAIISLKRIHAYLIGDERDPNAITRGDYNPSLSAITIQNGTFIWSTGKSDKLADEKNIAEGKRPSETKRPVIEDDDITDDEDTIPKGPTLSEIYLNIEPGELVAICGTVGSGKSSLLGAILGDIDCVNGTVEVNGRTAYASQNAWIQNATIRDNILFGQEENREQYKNAIRVCQLESDLEILTDGDMTEIGEKGINLSGGQKQRVSLARAVYNNADIYLLDDPLSAVDAHVGLAIFDQCIVDALQGKTRILVTHQLQHMPKVDRIIVLKDGKITELGTYQELIESGGEFSELMKKHVTETEDEKEEEKEETEEKEEKENKGDAKKLIAQEEREVGEVSRQVYKLYAISLGGFGIVTLLFLFFAMEQLSKVSADWWLSWWSDNPGETDQFYIGIYAAIGFTNGFFVLSRALLFAYTSLNSAKKIHERLLENILHTPMSFFDTTPAGRILNRFSKDQYAIDQILPRTISMFIIILFASCSILLVIGVVTPFFLTAVIPLTYIYVLVQRFYIRSSREVKRLDSVSRSPIFSHFDETLNGVTTIRAFGRSDDFIEDNMNRVDTNQRAYFISTTANRWLGIRLELLGAVVVGLASLFCVIERENIDAGSAGLSLTYALQTTSLLNWLVRMYTETEAQMVAVERLEEYSTIPTEAASIIPDHRPPKNWPTEGEIEFKGLQLRYREGLDLVLRGITCTIQSKEKIGVVGRTGAGKSTLMLALFRLVEPAGGSITIDGIDICTIGLADLRSRISIIPQDPTLFTGTFRSNLDPFNDFEDEQILKVLESVHLRNLVENNGGLHANVSEGGGNISVGQRQLMCLGRALLRRSKIIIMDEATASVDFETDSLIQETIRVEFAECTVLIIAHRIHTIESCNRVMVLDNGVIAEFDDPNILKQQDSIFSSMVSKSGTSKID